jgi:hypothetical protein
MKIQLISPKTWKNSIDPLVDVFIWEDHMPNINFPSDLTLDRSRLEYFGKNTIIEMFSTQGLNYKDYFFVFDTYLNLEGFDQNSFFYPATILNWTQYYLSYAPDHMIDFANKKNSVNCHMHKHRSQRILASGWFANNPIDGLLYTQFWSKDDHDMIMHFDELLQLGGLIDWTHSYGPESKLLEQHTIGTPTHLQNSDDTNKNLWFPENFFRDLSTMFHSTVFSIVLEPAFWEYGSGITEKYINAIYGGTIPVVNGYRVYDSLGKLGFDTFPDIIDTSSQYELDPVLRIWNMLEKNKNIFSQWEEIISDAQVQKRIINNLKLMQCPDKIFKNSLSLNSKLCLQRATSIRDSLKTFKFPYVDLLNDSD